MDTTTQAELANTRAIQWTRESIFWLRFFQFTRKYRVRLAARQYELSILLKRDERIGAGVRSK